MKLSVNGKFIELAASSGLLDILQSFSPPFAVAVNGQFVAQGEYARLSLKEGDVIDVVSPIQGG